MPGIDKQRAAGHPRNECGRLPFEDPRTNKTEAAIPHAPRCETQRTERKCLSGFSLLTNAGLVYFQSITALYLASIGDEIAHHSARAFLHGKERMISGGRALAVAGVGGGALVGRPGWGGWRGMRILGIDEI